MTTLSLEGSLSLGEVAEAIPILSIKFQDFAKQRKWLQFDNASNFSLCLLSELGKLATLFQWKDDVCFLPDAVERDKMLQEIADILIYTLRMAEHFGMISALRTGLLAYPS
jgi:hypothetical protein